MKQTRRIDVLPNERTLNAVTFDVEDYFQVEAVKPYIDFDMWESCELRVEHNMRKVLRILNEYSVKSTFFVLGWIAERLPQMVKDIQRQGHEIASHGYAHQMIDELTPARFRNDVVRAKSVLEDITGEQIIGYRAPTFSITKETFWALDILADEGFRYDSSIFPIHHDRYGYPSWQREITQVTLHNGNSIIEVPPATIRIFGFNLPAAGGGYLRIAPFWFSSWAIRRINNEEKTAIIYLHPWELDPDQPRFACPPLQKFRNYANLKTTEDKLCRLLRMGSLTRIRDILGL
jgi:polysaccharide deacetylase family protein (PEP-CTERM system associated)